MSNYIRAEITFGTEFDKSGASLFASNALKKIDDRAVNIFGGVTWSSSRGSWRDDSGATVSEAGQTVVICTLESRRPEIISLAKFIRDSLNQNCVAVSITPADFSFV